jgi:hypothetical protein
MCSLSRMPASVSRQETRQPCGPGMGVIRKNESHDPMRRCHAVISRRLTCGALGQAGNVAELCEMTIANSDCADGRGPARRVADRQSVLDERANMESTSAPVSRAPRFAPLVTYCACTRRGLAALPTLPPCRSSLRHHFGRPATRPCRSIAPSDHVTSLGLSFKNRHPVPSCAISHLPKTVPDTSLCIAGAMHGCPTASARRSSELLAQTAADFGSRKKNNCASTG